MGGCCHLEETGGNGPIPPGLHCLWEELWPDSPWWWSGSVVRLEGSTVWWSSQRVVPATLDWFWSHQGTSWVGCGKALYLVCARSLQSYPTLRPYHQAPLSVGFSRQEQWSGLPCPAPGRPSQTKDRTVSLVSPALVSGFFTPRAKSWWVSVFDVYTWRELGNIMGRKCLAPSLVHG